MVGGGLARVIDQIINVLHQQHHERHYDPLALRVLPVQGVPMKLPAKFPVARLDARVGSFGLRVFPFEEIEGGGWLDGQAKGFVWGGSRVLGLVFEVLLDALVVDPPVLPEVSRGTEYFLKDNFYVNYMLIFNYEGELLEE